jgi:hypothetical protein
MPTARNKLQACGAKQTASLRRETSRMPAARNKLQARPSEVEAAARPCARALSCLPLYPGFAYL